jgi:hypothetical protein
MRSLRGSGALGAGEFEIQSLTIIPEINSREVDP